MTRIGPFEILELIGRGAMGAVYRAVDPANGRLVAIKTIRLIGYDDPQEAAFLKERLFKEARAAGGLSHPGIVTVYQLRCQDEEAYIVMEYVDGRTLESLLPPEAPASFNLWSRVVTEVAAALDYAHVRGIVHRDIKPANILLAGHADVGPGSVKIADFGIAKTKLGRTVTQTGMLLGTPYYMSPEQIRGEHLDGRSDQFALAVMAYQMLTGRRPFGGENVTSICYQILHVDPLQGDAGLAPEVAKILRRALDKDSSRRFAACAEFAGALIQACRHDSGATMRIPPRRSTPARRRVLGLAAALSLCVISGGAQRAAPTSGRMVWTGNAGRGSLVQIENGRASIGHIDGQIPPGPVEVRVLPAESSPGHITDFSVWEAPQASNHWNRVVLRVNSERLTGFVVEWNRIAQPNWGP